MKIRTRVKRHRWYPNLYLVQYKVGFQLFWKCVNAAEDDYITPSRVVAQDGTIMFTCPLVAERVAENFRRHHEHIESLKQVKLRKPSVA